MDNKQVISEGHAYSLSIRQVRLGENILQPGNGDTGREPYNLVQHRVADYDKENQRKARARSHLNGASIGVLCRRMMAKEWARARGRKFPDYHILAFERKAKLLKKGAEVSPRKVPG